MSNTRVSGLHNIKLQGKSKQRTKEQESARERKIENKEVKHVYVKKLQQIITFRMNMQSHCLDLPTNICNVITKE